MNILIPFFSQTGNTEKIAMAMQDGLSRNGHTVQIERVEDKDYGLLTDYDAVLIGSACHSRDVAEPVKDFLKHLRVGDDCIVAGFVTHSTVDPTGEWTDQCFNTFSRECHAKNIPLKGYFSCLGKPSPSVEEFIHTNIIKNESHFDKYLQLVESHPDRTDLRHAQIFAEEVMSSRESDGVIVFFRKYLFSKDPAS
ncbi:MAG: flavodoxin domain-containing protein [Candidatus Thorarchaeota archaeon]|nr:flavodoxin domain-containing protein [Candidatus Thorarchaeota archaeon]